MKVGVISKGSPDYLIDIVCDGLIKLLGRHNVSLDYTHKKRWGGQYSILMAGVEQPNLFDIHDADCLVASDRSIPSLEEWCRKTGKNKVALIDGEDTPGLRYDPSKVLVYFKREYLQSAAHAANVKPLPFAAIPEPIPSRSIERPVFYLGNHSSRIRPEIEQALAQLGIGVSKARLEKPEYNNMLASSLVGVCPRGGGWDTYRYWEIPFMGCALLAQKPQIKIPDDFVEGKEAAFFSDVSEMVLLLKKLTGNPALTEEMAKEGQKACQARHLSIHRAKTVLEALA